MLFRSSESITTARSVKAKSDASMIAMGLINLQKDLGGDALSFGGAGGAQTVGLPDLLTTQGEAPEIDETVSETPSILSMLVPGQAGRAANAAANAVGQANRQKRRKWRETAAGSLDDHLMTNRHGYHYRRPGQTGGWNGPYVSAEITGDPWGKQYMVNTQFLDGGSTAADSQGQVRHAVFVVSPGANGVVETPFEQPINDVQVSGDDIIIRIQ